MKRARWITIAILSLLLAAPALAYQTQEEQTDKEKQDQQDAQQKAKAKKQKPDKTHGGTQASTEQQPEVQQPAAQPQVEPAPPPAQQQQQRARELKQQEQNQQLRDQRTRDQQQQQHAQQVQPQTQDNPAARPPGWDQGKKTGWGTGTVPPGQQARIPQERQRELIVQQQQRATQYQQHLAEQQRRAQQYTTQLQQQQRTAQYRYQQQYWDRLRQQQVRLQNERHDWDNDPYFYTAPSYRYSRNGTYYQINQYGADTLRQAVNYGYQEGFYSGQADRQDRWGFNYQQSFIYQDANYGYNGYYADQDSYNYYFRQGFQRGYDDGYYSRYQYGRNVGGSYNVLDAILQTILGLEALTSNQGSYGPGYGQPGYGYSQPGYSQPGYGYGYGYAGNGNAAHFGNHDGLEAGQRDRASGHSYRPTEWEAYIDADHGMSSSSGYRSSDEYKQEYRRAFMNGYNQAYGSWR